MYAHVEPGKATVVKHEFGMQTLRNALLHGQAERGKHLGRLQPRINFHHRPSHQFVAGTPTVLYQCVIDIQISPVETNDLAALHHVVQCPPVTFFAGSQCVGEQVAPAQFLRHQVSQPGDDQHKRYRGKTVGPGSR